MLMSVTVALMVLWLFVCREQWRQVKQLAVWTAYLPEATKRAPVQPPSYPLIGRNIREAFALPDRLSGQRSVLLLVSSTCGPCHSELEEFLERNQKAQLPFGCLLVDGEAKTEEFLSTYRGAFPLLLVEREYLDKLGLTETPLYLVLDEHGMVRAVNRLLNWRLFERR